MGQKPTKITKPWADQPFQVLESPTHRTGKEHPRWGSVGFADEMTLIHAHIIRILNCIYLQAPNVREPQDIKDFTTFIHAWCLLVHEHHGNEEDHFFPWIEEYIGIPGYMSPNVEQHHAFTPGMKALETYIAGLRDGSIQYDGQKVRDIIDGFGEILTQHLAEEITFLEGLGKFEDKIPWETLGKRIQTHAVSTAETRHVIPAVLTNGDNTWEKGVHEHYWPPFPWYVGLIFRLVHVPKEKGAWRFSCSDSHGNPRNLAFVDTKE